MIPLSPLCDRALQDPLTFGDVGNVRHGSVSDPTGPPPPYESVVTGSAGQDVAPITYGAPASAIPAAANAYAAGSATQHAAAANGSAPAYSSNFEIAVADPVKQGEGVSAYVSYKVCQRMGEVDTHNTLCLVYKSWQLTTKSTSLGDSTIPAAYCPSTSSSH